MKKESTIVTLHKFQLQKNVKNGKGPWRALESVLWFEETEYRERSRRPSVGQTRVAAEMETLESESAIGTSISREDGRRMGLEPFLIRNIHHEVFNQCPYKL
ncbi:hypothetical protein NPIL_584301 [Nephila pilipes]|uniref:Uncharacterized protein n=1 Tax=Nephila pilipes TaxID=299642 RepID=A0A8X6Q243_NEPPI|nr:hypothetical protein NPIL_584301 [Nephila pilipes]